MLTETLDITTSVSVTLRDAMLKQTGCELDLLTDAAMFGKVHENLRGGVAMISNRQGIANNKYMGDAYDPEEASKYLMYVDANNLYGWCMSEPLPKGDFRW